MWKHKNSIKDKKTEINSRVNMINFNLNINSASI